MSYYIGPFPKPNGFLQNQLYRWARHVTKWFEHWISAAASGPVGYRYYANYYHMSVSTANVTNVIRLYSQVYRGSAPFNVGVDGSRAVFHCVMGDGYTDYGNTFLNYDYTIKSRAGGAASHYVGRSQDNTDKLRLGVSKVGSWTYPMLVFGPYGLMRSTNMVK